MNGVLGMSDLLKTTDLNPEQEKYNKIIHNSGVSLLSIIDDILVYSKIEAGKVDYEKIPFRLQSLIHQISSLLQLKIKDKNLQLVVNLDPKITPVLLGDPGKIQQILLNLLSNAIKFTTEGTIELLITHSPNGRVQFSVSDTGPGLSAVEQRHIFSSFGQAASTRKKLFGGTGLGLTISQQLVKGMGGELTVRSIQGKGAEFLFSLPLPPSSHELEKDTRAVDMNYEELGLSILAAEDNPTNQLVLHGMLKALKCQLTLVHNGKEALDMFKSDVSFDLILMDCDMPLMSGVEAAKAIRQYEEVNGLIPITIIALTAHVLKAETDACLNAGMDQCVSKPFTLEKLHLVLQEYKRSEDVYDPINSLNN